jgi:hypothetical protein
VREKGDTYIDLVCAFSEVVDENDRREKQIPLNEE